MIRAVQIFSVPALSKGDSHPQKCACRARRDGRATCAFDQRGRPSIRARRIALELRVGVDACSVGVSSDHSQTRWHGLNQVSGVIAERGLKSGLVVDEQRLRDLWLVAHRIDHRRNPIAAEIYSSAATGSSAFRPNIRSSGKGVNRSISKESMVVGCTRLAGIDDWIVKRHVGPVADGAKGAVFKTIGIAVHGRNVLGLSKKYLVGSRLRSRDAGGIHFDTPVGRRPSIVRRDYVGMTRVSAPKSEAAASCAAIT